MVVPPKGQVGARNKKRKKTGTRSEAKKKKRTRRGSVNVEVVKIQPTDVHNNKVWYKCKKYSSQNNSHLYFKKGGKSHYYAWIAYEGNIAPARIRPGQGGARFASNIGEEIDAVMKFKVS